jgi:undecaprenyl pyrophosphate synthase
MTFLKDYLRREIEELHRNQIRFQAIGRLAELDSNRAI